MKGRLDESLDWTMCKMTQTGTTDTKIDLSQIKISSHGIVQKVPSEEEEFVLFDARKCLRDFTAF